jgi:hypothetical protein
MSDDLFATSDNPSVTAGPVDGRIPYFAIDGIFRDPLAVREAALALPYSEGTAHYPGRVARFPPGDPSLTGFLRKVVTLVARDYLPRLPAPPDGVMPTRVRGVDTDFAITDVPPDLLSPEQRRPHIDAVPVFGLVYLNQEARGGTLFFKPKTSAPPSIARSGYQTRSDEELEVTGRIEGRFNRLAIYPGFVLHSPEIDGGWIEGDERLHKPRLTQRIMFFL